MRLLVCLALVALAAARLSEQEYLYQFDLYKKTQAKNYAASEVSARYAAFKTNYDFVQQHNARFAAGLETYDVEMNSFADLTIQEFSKIYLRPFNVTRPKNVVMLPEVNAGSVDWRTKGAVTPVKNQGQCGSCWAFSTTGSVEGAVQIATGTLTSISEQQLVDCSGAEGNQGCNGGLMDYAFEYIIKNGGIDTEEDYAYTARDGSCQAAKAAKKVSKISGYKDVAHNSEAQLIAAVTQQPVSVAIEADQSGFQLYKSGVFSGPCGTQLDHGVLAVGYNTDSTGKNYWIVKNSWGASWGLQGYILMAQGKGAAGICGINMEPSYPTATGQAETVTATADSHYGPPPCLSDEVQVTITGITGTFCSPKCSTFKPCTTDVPPGTTATPECVLEAQGHTSPTNCALICTPGSGSGGCPTGASCQPIQGTGVCTYPQA